MGSPGVPVFTTRTGRAQRRPHDDAMLEFDSQSDSESPLAPPALHSLHSPRKFKALREPETGGAKTCPHCKLSKANGKGEGTWNGNWSRHVRSCLEKGEAGELPRTSTTHELPPVAAADLDRGPAQWPRSPPPKQRLSYRPPGAQAPKPERVANRNKQLEPDSEGAAVVVETSARTISLASAHDTLRRDFKRPSGHKGHKGASLRPSQPMNEACVRPFASVRLGVHGTRAMQHVPCNACTCSTCHATHAMQHMPCNTCHATRAMQHVRSFRACVRNLRWGVRRRCRSGRGRCGYGDKADTSQTPAPQFRI